MNHTLVSFSWIVYNYNLVHELDSVTHPRLSHTIDFYVTE